MPIIKRIKANQGDVAGKGEDIILTTGGTGDYGSNLASHLAIIARSEKGVGLFHATVDVKRPLGGWLKQMPAVLGGEVSFSILHFCELSGDYERRFKSKCGSYGIKAHVTLQKGAHSLLNGPIGVDNSPKLIIGEAHLRKKLKEEEVLSFEEVYYGAVEQKTPSEKLVNFLGELVQETCKELEGKIKNAYFYEDNSGRKNSIGELQALQLVLKGEDQSAEGPLNQKPLEFVKAKVRQHCIDNLGRQETESIAGFLQKMHVLFSYFTEFSEESAVLPETDDDCDGDWTVFSDEELCHAEGWTIPNQSDCGLGAVGGGCDSTTLFKQQHNAGSQSPDSNMTNNLQ
ncbi:hypothetical protein PsalN5692_03394 [Piscirickettsia salmonis]|uniref:hypothetical protein n=1 Tax=Piscirickettsia salmonis TaxID=1238 RepID=UPI0012B9CFEB|nr:hypothetical protein [Piscirickettsia salmonis]QGP51895.1 hypothetical protein PsalN5692_03394 [Piscirickettsia salmonis]